MATKASIIAAIQSKVGSHYSIYRIGLTHDLAERKAYWKDTKQENITHWSDWTADSLSDAQDIEAYFIAQGKGMKGGTGGNLSAYKTVYVYVF
jgi:hypothetical protein